MQINYRVSLRREYFLELIFQMTICSQRCVLYLRVFEDQHMT